MSKLGKNLWDDPNYVSGPLEPRNKGFDLGSEMQPFKSLHVEAFSILASTNGGAGTFTANGATAVVVSNTSITENSVIIPSLKTVGGTPGASPFMSAKVPGASFSMKAAAGDTSVYNYIVVEVV